MWQLKAHRADALADQSGSRFQVKPGFTQVDHDAAIGLAHLNIHK
jgi:hypothetical protein